MVRNTMRQHLTGRTAGLHILILDMLAQRLYEGKSCRTLTCFYADNTGHVTHAGLESITYCAPGLGCGF